MCHFHRNWSKRIIVIVLILTAISIPLPAMSAAISLDYSIGFNDHFQLNTWTPVTVFIENKGRSINGTLEVLVTSGSEYEQNVYQATYAIDVELPNNSKKSYALTVLIKSFTHDLIIRLRQDNKTIISYSVYLQPHFTEKSFAIVADNFPSPDILSNLPKSLFPVNMPPKLLPETSYGYDSVKLLIMNAATIRGLRERQYQALTQWIKEGGFLVTAGGLNYGALVEKRVQHILPMEVYGHQRLFEIKSLAQFCDQKLTSLEPFLVLNVRIDDSHVLVNENDLPIIIQKDLGSGQIAFLSFDFNAPPFSRWDGEKKFWDRILSLRSTISSPITDVDDQKILDSMFANMSASFPDFIAGGILIGIYLLFLKLFFMKISRSGKTRLRASLYLLMIIIAFTALSYGYFFSRNNKQSLTYNSFCKIDVSGTNALAFVKHIVGIYALEKAEYSLRFGSVSKPVTHILSKRPEQKIPSPYVLHESYGGQQILGFLNNWSHNFYIINSKLDSPLVGHAFRDDHHLTLKVENKLPFNLVNCMIYFKKRFVLLDDILAKKQNILKLKLSELKKIEIFNNQEAERIIDRFESSNASSFLKTMQSKLTKDVLLLIHDKYKLNRDSLFIIGWGHGRVIQPMFDQANPVGKSLTMVNWVLPVEITS